MATDLEKMLTQLLEALAKELIEKIQAGTATPQDMKNAIELLKNNGITCDIKDSKNVLDILKDIPFHSDSMMTQ